MIKRHFLLFMTLVLVTGCERILIGPQHENTPEGNLNYYGGPDKNTTCSRFQLGFTL